MLAGLYLGSGHLEQLCRATGVRRPSRLMARNLRAAGVWTAGGRTATDWDGARRNGILVRRQHRHPRIRQPRFPHHWSVGVTEAEGEGACTSWSRIGFPVT